MIPCPAIIDHQGERLGCERPGGHPDWHTHADISWHLPHNGSNFTEIRVRTMTLAFGEDITTWGMEPE